MSEPPQTSATPSASATTGAPGTGGRAPWRLLPILGVVVLLLVGAGAYFAARSYQGSRASQSCGGTNCIPRLEAATVVKVLEDRGFTCREDFVHRTCDLRIGFVRFEASLQVSDELIHRMILTIFRAESDPVTESGMAFLNWFATMPYARDPETSAQIEAWVAEQVNGNKDTRAIIGDYEYRLTNPETHTVILMIKAND